MRSIIKEESTADGNHIWVHEDGVVKVLDQASLEPANTTVTGTSDVISHYTSLYPVSIVDVETLQVMVN